MSAGFSLAEPQGFEPWCPWRQTVFKLFDDASNALIYCVSRLLTVSPTHHLSSDINDSKPLLFCEGLHALLHRITLLAQSTYNIRFADFKAYKSRRGKNFQSKEKTRKNRPNLKKTLGTTWGHLELQDLQFPTNVANFFAYWQFELILYYNFSVY